MSDPYEAFARDVPEHLREDAMTAMAEATGGYGKPDNVHLLDHDRIDAINCRAHGIITIEGREFVFQMQDGNWNGTELLSWDEDKPFERHEPTRWALQPKRQLIDEAVIGLKGPFLLLKWDAMLKNLPRVAEIPGKYSYDRFVQPGIVSERHWKAEAAKHHFDIVTEDTAQETRALLARSTTPLPLPPSEVSPTSASLAPAFGGDAAHQGETR